jgi:hypothetical protein
VKEHDNARELPGLPPGDPRAQGRPDRPSWVEQQDRVAAADLPRLGTTGPGGATDEFMKVVRLLVYIRNMREDYPDLEWPGLPDNYSELVWRYVSL